ncbi:ester cyclase [Nocardia abscessus]|uniref:ester cyclase n=1 Tax=Nocardia abscessus TaxID=120957 RepID=UPI0024557B8B|nr:ester cyclase [Nocardia abscessus]
MSNEIELSQLRAQVADFERQIAAYEAEQQRLHGLIDLFDKMDFEAFSRHDWDLFRTLHSHHTHVVMPDGSTIDGIDAHTTDMQNMVSFMPDLRITAHPVKLAMGDWTAVIGEVTGTFTEPMNVPGGTDIAPTGKHIKFSMATFARWVDGQIAEEILFWDNADMMKQLGLA